MEAERMWNGYLARENWMQQNLDKSQAFLNDMHRLLIENEQHSDVLNLRTAQVIRTPSKVYLSFRLDLAEAGELWGIGFDALGDCWFMQQEGETQRLQGAKEDLWDEFFHRVFLVNQRTHTGKSLMERMGSESDD